jgi:hypothetical protein
MKKKILPFLFILSLCFCAFACTNEKETITLTSILTANGGKWKVSFAKFGTEEAPNGMYDSFVIEFKNGGAYITTNPNGAISPALLPNGAWKEGGSPNTIVFDANVNVREITQVRTANKITFEWEVSIPGKVTTTYRIELVKAG